MLLPTLAGHARLGRGRPAHAARICRAHRRAARELRRAPAGVPRAGEARGGDRARRAGGRARPEQNPRPALCGAHS